MTLLQKTNIKWQKPHDYVGHNHNDIQKDWLELCRISHWASNLLSCEFYWYWIAKLTRTLRLVWQQSNRTYNNLLQLSHLVHEFIRMHRSQMWINSKWIICFLAVIRQSVRGKEDWWMLDSVLKDEQSLEEKWWSPIVCISSI